MVDDGNEDDVTRSFIQLTAGTKVSHYTIISKIGAGGMGEIYLADDVKLKRKVALKFLPPHMCENKDHLKRFTREAEAAALFSHPNIVSIHDVDEFAGRPYIVLDYIEGLSLRQIVQQKSLPIDQIVDYSIQICDGLDCAHQAGVIHRDLKLSNLIVDTNNRVRIVDFGLATFRNNEQLTEPGQMMGTSGYMSPEQISGETIDNRSDIFSFGVVLYEMITGIHPFQKENPSATLHAICYDDPDPIINHRPDIPEQFQEIINKALEKDRKLRYHHIDELKTDLLRYQSGFIKVSPKKRILTKNKWISALIFFLVIVTAGLIGNSKYGKFFTKMFKGPTIQSGTHLAILPVVDLTDSSWGQLFCAGLRETMTSRLTQMRYFDGSLWVVPASEITDRHIESVRDARKSFGATMIITSSLQKIGEDVRLVLNLVDANTERQLNSELIDLDMTKLQDLQDSTVSKMASMLRLNLKPSKASVLKIGNTRIPEAYGAYLIGRGYLQRYDKKESVDSAITKFIEAIGFDSKYALAYAGLGEAYWRKYRLTNEPELVSQAIENNKVALAMNDSLPEIHLALGRIYRGLRQFENAIKEFKITLSLSENDHTALRGMARSLEELGQETEAEKYYQKVIDLLPLYWAGYYDMALFHIYGNRFEKAIPLLDKAMEFVPQNSPDLNDIGGAYLLLGYYDRAAVALEKSIELEPTYLAYSNLGYLYYIRKDYQKASEAYEHSLAINSNDHRIWANLAAAYELQTGQDTKARDAYEHAIVEAQKRLKITPQDPQLIASLSEYYAVTDDTVKALDMASQAIRLDPNDTDILVRLVFAMEDIGKRRLSIDYLIKAIDNGYDVKEMENFSSKTDLLNEEEIVKHLEKKTQEG